MNMLDPILIALLFAAGIAVVLAFVFSNPKKKKQEPFIEPVVNEPLLPINEEIFDVFPTTEKEVRLPPEPELSEDEKETFDVVIHQNNNDDNEKETFDVVIHQNNNDDNPPIKM